MGGVGRYGCVFNGNLFILVALASYMNMHVIHLKEQIRRFLFADRGNG